MSTATALFTLHHWTVSGPNEDDNFEVWDQYGAVVDEATTLPDAIESCTEQATAAYRERLWEAIQNADPEGLPLYILQAIADQLGLNAKTI